MSKNNRYIHKRTLPGKVIGSLFGFPLVENNFPPDRRKCEKMKLMFHRNALDLDLVKKQMGWIAWTKEPIPIEFLPLKEEGFSSDKLRDDLAFIDEVSPIDEEKWEKYKENFRKYYEGTFLPDKEKYQDE